MEREDGNSIRIKMEEQSRKFARNNSSEIRGEVIVETGRDQAIVTVRTDNLSSIKAKYKIFLIGRKAEKSVYKALGEVIPDDRGRAEFQTAINPRNVDGGGTDLSCFFIFLIAAGGLPLQPVLKGEMAGRYNEMTSTQKGSYHRRNKKEYNSYYAKHIKQMTQQLIVTADVYDSIKPFDGKWLADDWKRVSDRWKLPVASAGAQEQAAKYGHFIFAYDAERFLLAVPGRHTEEEWPDRGASGFLLWQPIRNAQEYGYWCMVIDLKAGIITEIS